MTFDEYAHAIDRVRAENPRWRAGQTAFNVLLDIRPDLAEEIRATELDPFHNDNVLTQFYHWVRRQLKANEAQ